MTTSENGATEARGELAALISDSLHMPSKDIAAEILAAGYRKPKVLGYIVVGRDGIHVGSQHKHKESAQAFADDWTADCKTAGIDWDYRVAEIHEPSA